MTGSMVTVELSLLGAMNILDMIEDRMKEIDKLAEIHPTLPMKDPATYSSYEHAAEKLRTVIREHTAREIGIEL